MNGRYAEGSDEGTDGENPLLPPSDSIPLTRETVRDELASVVKLLTRADERIMSIPADAEGPAAADAEALVRVTANELLLGSAKLENLARMLGAGEGR